MKRFALLRLENGANKVIFDCHAISVKAAAEAFNTHFTPATPKLNDDGYAKLNNGVTICVAEYAEPFHTL
jgi:hypothetical protein